MMDSSIDVGSDHCRVVPIRKGANPIERIQYYRHLLPYSVVSDYVEPSGHVLEIGSGEGYGANVLASEFSRVAATDMSMQALSHVSSTYSCVRDLCQSNATRLPFASDSFDAVVSYQVIEHVKHTMDFLQEIHRVLRPGGKALLTTPNRRLRLLPFQKPWNPYHVREYSGRELHDLMSEVFYTPKIMGIAASQEITKIERKRVHQNPLLVYRDLLKQGVLQILPAPLRSPLVLMSRSIVKQVSRLLRSPQMIDKDDAIQVSSLLVSNPLCVELSSFFLTDAYDDAIDLLAIGKKDVGDS
jgi:2-polyprenyl-3-methyl-5-hydroxy-6-metoxy-1,4-benzoquinol methylase